MHSVFRRGVWLLGLAAASPGCVRCTERDAFLRERLDCSSPERTFETLRAAIRCGDSHTGYLLISEAMKEREHIDESLFHLGWEDFFQRHPWARLAGNAELTSAQFADVNVPGGGKPAGSANFCKLTASAYGRRLEIDLIRQDYYKITLRWSGRVIDGYLDSTADAARKPADDAGELLASIRDQRLAQVAVSDIATIMIGSEWAVLGFPDPADAQPQK